MEGFDSDFLLPPISRVHETISRLRAFLERAEPVVGDDDGDEARRYLRTLRGTALVFAYEAVLAFLVDELIDYVTDFVDVDKPFNNELIAHEEKQASGNFGALKLRYKWAGVVLSDLPSGKKIDQIRRHRNAIVHNRGLFTADYRAGHCPQDPPFTGKAFDLENDPDAIDNMVEIPIESAYVEDVFAAIEEFADAAAERLKAMT